MKCGLAPFSPRTEEVWAKGDRIQQSADLNGVAEVEGDYFGGKNKPKKEGGQEE